MALSLVNQQHWWSKLQTLWSNSNFLKHADGTKTCMAHLTDRDATHYAISLPLSLKK